MSAFEIFEGRPFGLGGVPFGNEFAYAIDEGAYATIEAAWNAEVRYFDASPWYGLGLAERRLGSFLQANCSPRHATTRKNIFRSRLLPNKLR
jgi:aryl-alcohol dehydrogenase-like predicted oxidoreductase